MSNLKSEFGTVYTQFKCKPIEAIKHLMKTKEGECIGALCHPIIGNIDIVWGEHDVKTNNGYGLKHIIEKHSKEIKELGFTVENFIPIVIQYGNLNEVKKDEDKIFLESSMFRVVIKTTWNNRKKKFLLSAFDLRPISLKKPK